MSKKMIGIIAVLLLAVCGYFFMASGKDDKPVIIYSTMEDFRDTELQKQLKNKFPDMEIVLQHLSTGDCAAKLKAEGTNTEADIILGFEAAYLETLKENFDDLNEYDASKYLDGLNPSHKKYLIWDKYSGVIVVNTKLMKELNLPIPADYEDLTKPVYKDKFVMPDPKTSGTAYMFVYDRVKALGETNALVFFDKLAKNTRQFTASGSAPINLLVQGEAPIGWGIICKAVSEINKGAPLKMIVPALGAPYSLEGFAITKGRKSRENVKKVFDFLYRDFIVYDKENFTPDQIFKDQKNNVPNYPADIHYADMTGIEDMATKEHLLSKWKY